MVPIRPKGTSVVLNTEMPAIAYLLDALSLMARDPSLVLPRELVITSGNDSQHSPNSRHYRYEAIDIRSQNFPTLASKRAFRARYEQVLGERFRVLLEGVGTPNEHFHAQVRMGQVFP